MNSVINLIPDKLAGAIGWTLFHSIWQVTLAVLFYATILFLSGSKSARLRYTMGVISLIACLGMSTVTFIGEYKDSGGVNPVNEIAVKAETVAADGSGYSGVFDQPVFDLPASLKSFFSKNLSLIVRIWLAGFMLFSLRLAGGFAYIQRLRHSELISTGEYWPRHVEELSRKIGLKQIVLIFESLRVKTPVVIGYLKPVILLPLGMISGLPQDQVEALIVHELVHIRRYDFIVNILESFIETIFFFHPLVWWISHQINAEREHCCDDAVVNLYGGTIVYTKALYNLEQIRSIESGFALAATGKKNQLYRRIIRMNTKNNNTVTGVRIAAFALLLIAMAAVSIYSSSLAATSSPDLISASFVNPFFDGGEKFSLKQPSADPVIPDTLSLKKGARTIKFSGDLNGEEKKFKARLKDGKLEELFIDGEKVAPADLPKYENMVVKKTEEYDSAMRNYREAMKNYKTSLNDYKEKMKQFRGNRFDNEYNSDFRVDSLSGRYFDSSELREAMKELRRNLKESFADKSQSMPPINIPQINIPPINIPPIHIPPVNLDNLFEGLKHLQFDSTEFNESMKEFNEKMKDFKFDMEKFKKEMKNNFVNNEAFRNNMKELKKNMGTLKEKMRPLKGFLRETRDEMIKDNLIEPGEDLDGLKLTKEGMYLNGKKMSDDQHKKYLGIYKKHFGKEIEDDDGIDFNN